ncbi:MAG TPA: hypothetical protein VG248_09350 [Caulobacteraceae bacterium]|nr:hypothetical protein [Caulobacteraceae bacterium]
MVQVVSMDDVEPAVAAVDVSDRSGAAAAAPPKPWLKPRLETWSLVGQTEGARGSGGDSGHCLS